MSEIEETKITVMKDWTGSRLDRFVRAVRPALSFPVIQTLIRKGKILLNGKKAPGKARLKDGDVVEIRLRKDRPAEALPEIPVGDEKLAAKFGDIGMGIPVLFEDNDILVIDKPAGLPVQPGNRSELGSLLDLLCRYLPPVKQDRDGPQPFAASPVHRLDIETSGVMVIAKTRLAAREMSRALAERESIKTYLAVVDGIPDSRSGTIDMPLTIEKGESSRAVPDRAGQPAVTHYSVIRKLSGGSTLLEIIIETGRTHQIRAHMQSVGHPVSGDPVYGSDRGGDRKGRMLLHAWKISLPHPVTGDTIEIVAPPPPEFGL
jgi:23S rRNA pseudouridine1911/1915/1917 synthase